MKYWRTMLIASALGVCGLAVWANDEIRGSAPKSAPVPARVSEPQKDIAFPPTTAAEPSETEPPTRVLELVATPAPPSLPIAPPVVPPVYEPPIQVLKAETPPPPLSSEPPPIPKAALELPPPMPRKTEYSTPLVPTVELSRVPPPSGPAVNLPKLPPSLDAAPPAPPIAEPTTPVKLPAKAAAAARSVPSAAAGSYKLYVRMGGNLGPRFEVKDGDTLLLKVYCEKIDLQGVQEGSNVLPGLTASGRVRVSGSGLNGTCDHLTLASVNGEVLLKGNVRMTCYRGNASSQINAESMSFQLKGSDDVPAKVRSAGASHIVPVSK